MEENQIFKLMEGEFKISEAQNIILNFYAEKIKFHNRHLLQMKLKNDAQTHQIEMKLQQLISSRDSVIDLLNKHINSNQTVTVKADIALSFNS